MGLLHVQVNVTTKVCSLNKYTYVRKYFLSSFNCTATEHLQRYLFNFYNVLMQFSQ